MFTDVEMAILSQLAYCDYPPKNDLPVSLHDFLTQEKNLSFLSESLGPNYTDALNTLLKKTEAFSYKIVAAEDDRLTGFAAFAVEGPDHEVITACRGTEMGELLNGNGIVDVLADIQLTLAEESAQQKKMRAFVEQLEKNGYNGYYFTGHSLGGNIALHGAITVNDPSAMKSVITFNAPGYNSRYLESHKQDYNRICNRTTNYRNKRDSVSCALISPGNAVYLDCADPNAGGIKAHSLDQLIVDNSNSGFKNSEKQTKQKTLSGVTLAGLGVVGNELGNTFHQADTQVARWFGTTIKVPLSTLRDNAKRMQSFADTNADVFDRVYKSLLCLKGSGQWQGTSLEAIVEATEKNQKKFEETIDELQSLATFLDKFVTEISDKDLQIKKQIESVG